MHIEELVSTLLMNDSGVLGVCPAARIKVPGAWQNLDAPYIVHFPVSGRTTHVHSGLQALRQWDFYQVSVYADTYSAARTLAGLVVAALDGAHDAAIFSHESTVYGGREQELEHLILNFRIAETLA